ncbi:MAG: FAD-dependent oxidoreductase [Treponema sp.]|jgi:choline dehydrogenase-like flavoprotein|nr:FAD-dependent oxidoreductase [Treponema sp.]
MLHYYGSYDVVVCGGGTSGVTAAVASARTGAKTLLIERTGQLGGQMNFSGPPGFSYAYLFNALHEQVIAGFAGETHKRLLEMGHALPHTLTDWRGSYVFSYVDPDWWGLLVYQILTEEKAEMMLHSLVTDVIKEGSGLKGVVVEHPSGRSIVLAKVVIDCTGEGEVGCQAGAQYEIESRDVLEPSTVAFTADGVDWDKALQYIKDNLKDFLFEQADYTARGYTRETVEAEIKKAKSILEIGEIMGYISLRDQGLKTGGWHGQSGVGFFLMPKGGRILAHFQHSSHVGKTDATDVRDITRVEIEARRQDVIAFNFFKKYVPGFENAYITRVCPEARVRETRRIMGDYKIMPEDILESRKFKDVIGKSPFGTGSKHAVGTSALVTLPNAGKPKDKGSHDIPYRALVPIGLENLLIAGKAISAHRECHHRFLMETIVTGQAAGAAAALCAKKGITPREMEKDVSELQDVLRKQDVILDGTK